MSSMAQQRDINQLKELVASYHMRLVEIEERLGKVENRPKPGRPTKGKSNA